VLMVIFGAGASYDSAPSHPPLPSGQPDSLWECRMPLADQLFEERALFATILERFHDAQPVVPWLRHLERGKTVESVLEQLQAEADSDPRRHRQLAAIRYYLQSAIWDCESTWDREAARGVTNYKGLLDLIEHARKPKETVCIVTFNYDMMLEAALPTVGIEIRSIGDYIANKSYKIIKLHGSVNWGREVEPPLNNLAAVGDGRLVTELIERAANLTMTDRYHVINHHPFVRLDAQRVLVPAIAIPVQRKGGFECPTEHLTALQECLPQVRSLLVIGWRATDAPFLDLLRTKGLQGLNGLVVAGSPGAAREVIDNLMKGLDQPTGFREAPAGFTDFILRRDAAAFLASP
jgi:hypothetical protein